MEVLKEEGATKEISNVIIPTKESMLGSSDGTRESLLPLHSITQILSNHMHRNAKMVYKYILNAVAFS